MTKRFMIGAAAITTSILFSMGSAGAVDNMTSTHPDGKFFKEAAQGGMAEVALGQMAADKAVSAAVKNFGQRMVIDHGKANQELKELAVSEGVTLPTEMSADAKVLQEKLSGLSGAAFDKKYMKEMVKDHKKDISAFKMQAEQGRDEDVKQWAAKTLPTLQEHYTLAQTTRTQVEAKGALGATSSGTMGSADRSSGKDTSTTPSDRNLGTYEPTSPAK